MANSCIAIDLDGVTFDFTEQIIEIMGPADQSRYSLYDWYPGKQKEIDGLVYDPWTYKNLHLLPGATMGVRALQLLGYDIVYCTARPMTVASVTYEQVHRHLPLAPIIFTAMYGKQATKALTLLHLRFNVSMAIDDSEQECDNYYDAGIRPLMMAAPWNKPNKNFARFDSWADIISILGGKI